MVNSKENQNKRTTTTKSQIIIRERKTVLKTQEWQKDLKKKKNIIKEHTERLIPRLKLVKLWDLKKKANNLFECLSRKNM